MHLDHINLQSQNPARMAQFYRDVMGMKIDELSSGYLYCHAANRKVLISEGENKLGFGAFACNSRSALAQLRTQIQYSGLSIMESTSPLFDRTDAFCVEDPDGNIQHFSVAQGRFGATKAKLAGRLQHLVVTTTDMAAMKNFYESTLGFKVSDVVVDEAGQLKTCFLRSDDEHHSFALFSASSRRLDHHCYEAENWNSIRDWADHLVANNVKIAWGPGRHGPGNNLFLMFNDPDGNWLEISAELQSLPKEHEPGTWSHCEKTLNLWGKGIIRT